MTAAVAAGNRLVRDRATWLMYGGLGFLNFLVCLIGPALPLLRDELGMSHTVASLHFSALAAGLIVSGTVTDRVAARFGRRPTFWLGVSGTALGGVIVAVGTYPAISIGGTLTAGLFAGALLSMTSAVLSEVHGERRATALVEGNVVASTTGALAPLLLGGLAVLATWRLAFALPAVVAVAAVLMLRAVPLPERPAAVRGATAWRVRQSSGSAGTVDGRARLSGGGASAGPGVRLPAAYWMFWVVLFLADCLEFSMTAWGATYLREVAGFSAAAAATAASLFLLGVLAGRIAGSRLLLAGREPRVLLTVSLLTVAAGFLLFRLGPADPLTLAGLLVTGVGVANIWPLTLAFALGAAGGATDVASSRASLAAGAGILTAPLTLGAAADHLGIATAFWLVLPLALAALLTASAAHRR